MALPGLTIVTSHDWLGCPVIPTEWGSPANAVLLSAPYKAAPATVVINLVFTSINRDHRRRVLHRKSNAVVTFADNRRGDRRRFPQRFGPVHRFECNFRHSHRSSIRVCRND